MTKEKWYGSISLQTPGYHSNVMLKIGTPSPNPNNKLHKGSRISLGEMSMFALVLIAFVDLLAATYNFLKHPNIRWHLNYYQIILKKNKWPNHLLNELTLYYLIFQYSILIVY